MIDNKYKMIDNKKKINDDNFQIMIEIIDDQMQPKVT